MLDCFEIVTTSGVVLWSKSYAPVGANIINSLINDVFIEEKVLPAAVSTGDTSAARNPAYKKEKYTLKWTTAKDLGLIFVVRPHRYRLPRIMTPITKEQLLRGIFYRPSINRFSTLHGLTDYLTISRPYLWISTTSN